MAARGRRAGGWCGVSAGPAAARPGSRCRGWHWGRQGSRSHLLGRGGAARAQPPAQLSCQAGTGPRELRRAAPAGRGGRPGLRCWEPLPRCRWLPCLGRARETLEVPGERELSGWRCGCQEPDGSQGPGWCRGARSPAPWGGGVCLSSSLFKPFPFVSARCFLLLSKSGTASPGRLPSSTETPGTPPARACTRATSLAGTPSPIAFPTGQAEGLRSPQPRSRATLLPRGGGRQGHRCSPAPSGRGMGAQPGYLGPFPSSQRARGPCGARGRGPAGWLAPCSPSWVTHPPQCGCEVPRQRL